MSDFMPAREPHPAALLLAQNLVTRYRLRLTDANDSRLGELAGGYELGLAAWTGSRSVYVGFYTPPEDAEAAGRDLAERCYQAERWGERRLTEQGSERCDILLIAFGRVEGSLSVPPQQGAVRVSAVSVDMSNGDARNLLAPPQGLPDTREIGGAVRAVLAGQPTPTLAAVDLAERQTVAGGYAQPAAGALRQTPVLTYGLIGLWVVIWLAEFASNQNFFGQTTNNIVYGAAFSTESPDWWRFLSSAFLHLPTNPLHIAFNSFFMWQIGRYVELLYGRLVLLGTFILSALVGSVFVLLGDALKIEPIGAALGASGGLCGFLTLWFVLGVREGTNVPIALRETLRQNGGRNVVFILIYSVVFAAAGGVAASDHIGGFVGGAIAGLIFPPLARVGGRDLRVWEKVFIYLLIAFAAASLLYGLYFGLTA